MKLKNRKTGEKAEVEINNNSMLVTHEDGRIEQYYFDSLKDLEEWTDYEEPKGIKNIYLAGATVYIKMYNRKEAIELEEKLKAWRRLEEFGFRFIDWELDMKTVADGKIWFDIGTNTELDAERLLELKPEAKELLDILFGGEK